MNCKILIGTAKGLVVYNVTSDDSTQFEKVHFIGFNVSMVFVDQLTNRWWVGLSHRHWGQKLHFSDNEGKNWEEVAMPTYQGAVLPNGQPAKLRQVWTLSNGGVSHPGRLWMGTDPGGLFISEDNGQHFELVRSLWDHPSRKQAGQWFGAGSDHPFIHSIVVDPDYDDHIYLAVSCAGIFKSEDDGKSWHPKNNGLRAAYLPNPSVEVGHDPHLLLQCKKDPNVLWQQNHCGIYVSRNRGEEWQEVSGPNSFPYYGFGLAIDECDPAAAWVFPVESDENRIPPQLRLQVSYTNDYGETWSDFSNGLPLFNAFDIVLRQAAFRNDHEFVFGTSNGNVYRYHSTEQVWKLLTSHLTKVSSIVVT